MKDKTTKTAAILIFLLMCVFLLKIYTTDTTTEPQKTRNLTPCEVLDATANGYENSQLVNECLNSIPE